MENGRLINTSTLEVPIVPGYAITAYTLTNVVIESGHREDPEASLSGSWIEVNGIEYKVVAWVEWKHDRWMIKHVNITREGEYVNGARVTDNARRKIYDDVQALVSEHVEGNTEFLIAGDMYRLSQDIDRLEKEISQMKLDLVEKQKALRSARTVYESEVLSR